MGLLKRQILGEISGKIGNIIIKQRGKMFYISPSLRGYKTPQDEKSINNRSRFSFASSMASSINSLPLIKKIWSNEIPDCYTIYHKLLSSNYSNFKSGILTGTPQITPAQGFPVPNPSIDILNNSFIIRSAPLSNQSLMNINPEPFVVPVTVFLLESQDNPTSPIKVMSRTGVKQIMELEKLLCLTVELGGSKPILPQGTTLLKSWTVIITLDEKENPVHYSDLIPWPK